jgi:hypothetical protein
MAVKNFQTVACARKAWNWIFKPWSNFASWGVHPRKWGAIFVNITDFWSFIDLEFNFEVFAVILLHFNVTKMNQGSYLIFKQFCFSSANHRVVLYRNMRILRRKLRCDSAYFKPCARRCSSGISQRDTSDLRFHAGAIIGARIQNMALKWLFPRFSNVLVFVHVYKFS